MFNSLFNSFRSIRFKIIGTKNRNRLLTISCILTDNNSNRSMGTIMGDALQLHPYFYYTSLVSRFSINQSVIEIPDWAETFARPIPGYSINQKKKKKKIEYFVYRGELLYRPQEREPVINWIDKLKLVAIIDPIF